MADDPIQQAKEELLARMPGHLRKLGEILRASVGNGDLSTLAAFLDEHGVEIPKGKLDAFRDVLIVGRIDLSDIAPAARKRLRSLTLATQNMEGMTSDYREALVAKQDLHCRDCKYFVTPPYDDGPNADKACVAFGTRGADEACVGFLWK